ncbi:MAG TPA: ribose 5-phosphate isomerase B [Candidatus Hydrogenedentes bacterium]|nr:ribose 5-phosphate isomerase B [Candidatus Hydrogenedentota bacterium]
MIIAVGSDHAGYEGAAAQYKPAVMEHLRSLGHEVIDCGTKGPESVDYPDFAAAVCKEILAGRAEAGVLICGTGIGMGIVANRRSGIRAAVCATPDMARLSREHNDANILCVGKRVLSLEQVLELLDIWLDTPFSGGERHCRRVQKMG